MVLIKARYDVFASKGMMSADVKVTESNNNEPVPKPRNRQRQAVSVFENEDNDDEYDVVDLARKMVKGQNRKKETSDLPPDFRQAQYSTLERRKHSKTELSIGEDENSSNSGDSPTPSTDGELVLETQTDETTRGSSFRLFARNNFTGNATPVYSCGPLQQPLLPVNERGDYVAALACWVSVLRIMGDIPDMDHSTSLSISGSTPDPLTKLKQGYATKYTKRDVEELHKKIADIFHDPASPVKDIPFLSNDKDTMLEKIQFVCMLGVYRRDIRDEIYCQICKQLSQNPNLNSRGRGWVLLYLCTGCFGPSDFLATHFISFLREASPEMGLRCEQLLRGTLVSGTRGYPPSWLEFQAAKNNKPILLPVSLMNSKRLLIQVEPSTTVNEFCRIVASKANIVDRTGFSIYITLFRKISCLGSGQHRVMDAVCECEQYTKQMGMRESSATWRLYFRKELFAPWQSEMSMDEIMLDLVYRQVSRGVTVGEYRCGEEDEIVQMAAKTFYIEYPEKLDKTTLETHLSSWLPEKWQDTKKDKNDWTKKAEDYLQQELYPNKVAVETVKRDVVHCAFHTWVTLFSRCYDLNKFHGPGVQLSAAFLLVNSHGLSVLENENRVSLKVAYMDVHTLTKASKHTMSIETLQGDNYEFTTLLCEDLYQLVNVLIEGLKQRSQYAVVITPCALQLSAQNTTSQPAKSKMHPSDKLEDHLSDTKIQTTSDQSDRRIQQISNKDMSRNVTLIKGNIVYLIKPFSESSVSSGTIACKTLTSDQTGMVDKTHIHVLATMERPEDIVLKKVSLHLTSDQFVRATKSDPPDPTLEDFSKTHFKRRGSDNVVMSLLSKASFTKRSTSVVWAHTTELLKEPLLRALYRQSHLVRTAYKAFSAMLQFSGDAHRADKTIDDITLINNAVIEPAIRNRAMRDEVYCQLIKQLTNNPNTLSEHRYWELLTLVAGTCAPSNDLYQQCVRIITARKPHLAPVLLPRLTHIKRNGGRRYPPHTLEHSALTSGQLSVPLTVFYPNHTSTVVQVSSTTRCSEVMQQIAISLTIPGSHEFGLFYNVNNKVLLVPVHDYIFDFFISCEIYHSPGPAATKLYVFFMKKLWFNSTPGQSEVTDTVFHYHQELPNYLRSYHQCSLEDAPLLAAYIFIATHGKDASSHLSTLKDHLKDFIPSSLIKKRGANIWTQDISAAVGLNAGITTNAAKSRFLTILSKLKTYGCVFFEVKMRIEAHPSDALLAISTSGVHLLDKDSKAIFETHVFSKIPNWHYDATTFTLIVGDSNDTSKIVLETSVGHNIDTLIMDYISWLMNFHLSRKKSGERDSGESDC